MKETPLNYAVQTIAGGSRAEFARLLEVDRSTISGWDNPARRAEGMAGSIPSKYFPTIIRVAAERGVALDLHKLMGGG